MIIVEGPDGSGKTTLAKKISESLHLPYMRYPGQDSEVGPDDGRWDWWDDRIRENKPGVYDRCAYISEIPYQLIMRGRPLVADGHRMRVGITDLWMIAPVIVFCLPPWSVQKSNISQQPLKLKGVTEEDLEKVSWVYHSLFAMWKNAHPAILPYDYTVNDQAKLLRRLEGYCGIFSPSTGA